VEPLGGSYVYLATDIRTSDLHSDRPALALCARRSGRTPGSLRAREGAVGRRHRVSPADRDFATTPEPETPEPEPELPAEEDDG